jgi:polyhydroxybutyrate depolymerase
MQRHNVGGSHLRLSLPKALRLAWLAAASIVSACGGSATEGAAPAPVASPGTVPSESYPGAVGDFSKTLVVSGVSRNYLLHVPASYRSTTPSAVVLLLHGGTGSATTVGTITGGFSGLSERSNFIAVYPDSVSGRWDDGRETTPTPTNDVAFVAALLDALATEYNVDARRIYATGISNGGMMTLRLACELSGRFAAVATVAANMPAALAPGCNPSRPVPLALFSGTQDPLMPYAGGSIQTLSGIGSGGTVLSVPETVDFWVRKNAVTGLTQNTALPDTDATDGTTTDLLGYGGATSGGEVALYRVNGGGHTWPGGTQYLPAALVGKVSKDFSANEALWAFFARHAKP